MSRIFLDTNVLACAHDQNDPQKWTRARDILRRFDSSPDTAMISTQVLQEFYNTLTRKFRMTPLDAKAETLRLTRMSIILLSPAIILAATDLHASASISFWDALIVAAAQSAGCDELWSEDLQDGRAFGSLKIRNPFGGSV